MRKAIQSVLKWKRGLPFCLNVVHSSSLFRYSLTEEGLALGERLESLEGTKGPEGDREEARSEGNEQEEGEEGGPGFVDLTVSDDDEEEKEEERIQ